MTYKYVELSSCVKGEKFKYTFKGTGQQYVGLLTEKEYKDYLDKGTRGKLKLMSSPAILTSSTDEEKLYIVRDLGDKDMPKDWTGNCERFSPLMSDLSVKSGTSGILKRLVVNADDSEAEGSMIDYWKDNQSVHSRIDLTKATYQCPSCGKTVSTSKLDGAHVNLVNGGDKKKYIIPTCQTCNRSKVKRKFEVNPLDLVEAPK